MAKNIVYLIVIAAAFLIVLFNGQLNIIIKIIGCLSLAAGAAVLIDTMVKSRNDKKNN